MKRMFGLLIAALFLSAIFVVSAQPVEKSEPLSKISIGGGWSISISGSCPNAVATVTAPNGVRKVFYHTATIYGGSSVAPYKCVVQPCPGYGGAYWAYF